MQKLQTRFLPHAELSDLGSLQPGVKKSLKMLDLAFLCLLKSWNLGTIPSSVKKSRTEFLLELGPYCYPNQVDSGILPFGIQSQK